MRLDSRVSGSRVGGRLPLFRPTLVALLLSCLILVPSGAGAAPGKALAPNLVPWAPHSIYLGPLDNQNESPPYALRFGVTIANRGEVALDFRAEDDPDSGTTDAAQCVRWVAKRICTEREARGEFIYHAEHGHYHIVDFAQYELRTLAPDGTPDPAPGALVAGGQKVSFCVQDTSYDSGRLTQTQNPLYLVCQRGIQGISAGWADTYDPSLPGQQIPLEGIPDGRYALVVTVDPTHRFFEDPAGDNSAYTAIEVMNGGTEVVVI